MSSYTSSSCQHFDFLEIQLATENFNESLVVGRGGFGKVYEGTIFNGSSSINVAIKRLDYTSHQGPTEFWAEVDMLTKLRHCNLVSLIGYCNYKEEMILVYEYMPNGTLADHLHELGTSLSWLQRLKICIGAARGLQYLHTGTGIEFGVIHRDVKSSNILLHESWAAKISDFGLSKVGPANQPSTGVSTAVKGTFGYLDPDYYATGKLTRKSDVYAFGVVLLEMLCRKRAVDKSLDQDQWNLARWAQESIKAGNLRRIIDCDIGKARLESVLALQEKINSSLQASGKTIFGRIVDRLYFPYNGEHTAHGDSKVASDMKDNDRRTNNSIVPDNTLGPDYNIQESLFGKGNFGEVFLAWVDKNTFTPSRRGDGIAVAIRRCCSSSNPGHDKLLAEVDAPDTIEPLTWRRRLNIMIGVARGLTYLHSLKDQVIHRNVKSSSIFLDQRKLTFYFTISLQKKEAIVTEI
ncbi:concanavalin A-like lectin/glucanase [Tanacetum coccineum]